LTYIIFTDDNWYSMKIICPECATDFDVPIDMIGDTGRRVRCNHCGHIWMQGADEEPRAFGGFTPVDDITPIDPIPLSLHPDLEIAADESMPAGPSFFGDIKWGYLGRMVGGFVAAGAIVLAGMLFMAGASAPAEAPDLKIKDVTAILSDGNTVVAGMIVNEGHEAQDVPALDIVPMAADGTEGEGMHVTAEKETLEPLEKAPFSTELHGAQAGDQIRLRFID
jgi:predicted Zn finger-like uncharacterized protein